MKEQHRYMGRAGGPKYKQVPSNGPPGRPWKQVPTRARAALEASAHLRAILRPPASAVQHRAGLMTSMAKKRGAWVKMGLPSSWKVLFRRMGHCSNELLASWAQQLSAAAAEEIKEQDKLNARSWRDWAKEATEGSAGQAHRWTKPVKGWAAYKNQALKQSNIRSMIKL